MQKSRTGFTLIELMVVVTIIAVLAAEIAIVLNPLELIRRSHDAIRLSDLENIQKAIEGALQSSSPSAILCQSLTPPCSGQSNSSDPNNRHLDGTGWVKVNLTGSIISFSTLPIDPVNDSSFYYAYSSDGKYYELDAKLESVQFQSVEQNDGGNNLNLYETGTDLNLLP